MPQRPNRLYEERRGMTSGKAKTIRRKPDTVRTVTKNLNSELQDLVKLKFTGNFLLKGSMSEGGIGDAKLQTEPATKNLLKTP